MSKPPGKPRSKKDWEEWLQSDCVFATRFLVESGSVEQQFILHTRDDHIELVMAPAFDPQSKVTVRTFMQLLCLARDVRAVSILSEAWMTTMPLVPGESDDQIAARANEMLPPSKSEVRKEILAVVLIYFDEDGERQSLSSFGEITRGPSGEATGVDGFESLDETAGGAMIEILARHRPDPQVVAEAKLLFEQFFSREN